MKKCILLPLFLIMVTLSCTMEENNINIDKELEPINIAHRIYEDEPIDIADRVLGKQTRSGNASYNIEYILRNENSANRMTRSGGSDTLAYILNTVDSTGFMIVSADDRVYPILAYSEEGNLEYEESPEDPVYANFISRLDAYMDAVDFGDFTIVPDDIADDLVLILPKMYTKWHQRYPFDKYVIQEYPGCPVGCVAVATGQIMVACKNILTDYHGENLFLFRMRSVFRAKAQGQDPLSYDEMLDKAAKLLYHIGKDVQMSYEVDGSGAGRFKGYALLDSLNFDIKEDTLVPYSAREIARSITDGYIVYIRGTDIEKGGHAWVIDGAVYHWEDPTAEDKQMRDPILLHCNWGWSGSSNGYYSGEVFSAGGYSFGDMEYFSVKEAPEILLYGEDLGDEIM